MAELISLNIGALSPAILPQTAIAPATKESFVSDELGASGTPIFGGFLRELGEYNPELTGLSAYRIYERMRRSDGQVKATLRAIKLPIRGAEWKIQAPPDANPIEKEATEFIESCVFDELDFDAIVSNALLMLDFGAAMHEDVYYIDGKNVRLRKCAPRLPLTFYRFLTAPDSDELVAVEQMGYRGGDYIVTQVPVDKLTLFTFDQEGANYTGLSILRAAYQHWFIKANLYKIEAIAIERNGMGVPYIRMGPDAKTEDRAAARDWLQQLNANESASILLPPNWEFGMKGVEGTVHSPKDAIEHHNAMITKVALAQFMDLGSGKSGGNRALGETMSDFFFLSLQATAQQIARQFSLTTIKRLCDFNFTGLRAYPRLVPQQIISTKFEAAVDALQKLSQGTNPIVREDQDIENWVRQKIGAPPAGISRGPIAAPAGAKPAEGGGRSDTAALSAKTFTPNRPLKPAERFLALAEMSSALDRGRDEIAAALRVARPHLQAEVIQKLMARPLRESHRVSIDLDAKLVDTVGNILRGISDYGLNCVESERKRQISGANPPDAGTVRGAADKNRDPLGIYADGVVSEFTNNLQARATNIMLDARRKDTSVGEQLVEAGETLDSQSDGWIDNISAKGANEAFTTGRAEGYDKYADEISRVLYSALLDGNTCDPCMSADGQEGDTPEDVPAVPNPDCEGGDKCRCVHVFVFADEAKAA